MTHKVLIGLIACAGVAACEGTDETQTLPLPCQTGTARTECLPDASAPDQASDGGITEPEDAASSPPDAAPPDATPGDAGVVCVESLDDLYGQCPIGAGCETLDGAVEYVQSLGVPFIVRRNCQAEDGTPMLSIGHVFGASSRTYIYEVSTGSLVAVQIISDYSEFCNNRAITAYSRVPRASTGALALDCGYEPFSEEYSQCTETDAGTLIIRWDGGTPEECIFGN